MKKISITILSFLVTGFLFTGSIMAANLTVQISDLPEYEKTNTFKLSYTALQIESQPITAQFTCQKEGGDWHNFGGVINGENGSAETNSSVIGSEGKYNCRVDATSNGETVSSSTSTTVDWSAPDVPSDYGKDKINSNTYRLTWKTPNNNDFDYVAVYRYPEQNFIADSGSLIAQVSGAKDTKIIWENTGLEINRDYFYALMAVDKAGNASGLVGDGGTVNTVVVAPSPTAGFSAGGVGKATSLPKEKGEILGESVVSPTPTGENKESVNSVNQINEETNSRNSNLLVVIGGLILLAVGGYFILHRRSS